MWEHLAKQQTSIKILEILASVIAAIPVALIASYVINYKLINKLAKKMRVTTKYGDENLYSYYLETKEIKWVYIRDIANKLTYRGNIVHYAENSVMQEIVLSDVSVYGYENSDHYYDVPSVYLTKKLGEMVIEAAPEDKMEKSSEG